MDQDDTARRLKRTTPWDQVHAEIESELHDLQKQLEAEQSARVNEIIDDVCRAHHWTPAEYSREKANRFKELARDLMEKIRGRNPV